MTRILLVRHGHVEGIEPERFRGRRELALTARGRAEAAALAARIASGARPSAIYTSPMGRCVETGGAIARAVGLEPRTLGELNDIDYGDWTWRTHEAARAEDPQFYRRWLERPQLMRFPGGESLQDLALRAADAVRLVLERHADQTVLLVGHDSINRAILLQMLDQPLSAYWRIDQSPCAINEIEVTDQRICVRRVNDAAHLERLAAE
jgi:probable phosphoglycerate mutase